MNEKLKRGGKKKQGKKRKEAIEKAVINKPCLLGGRYSED